ncbi:MAG: general secretion pathway protein GspB [Thiogranum sp.]
MSYILEALKKSEQQREIGRVPGITSVHEHTAKSVTGKWLWLIAGILLLNAGLLAFLLWPETEHEPDSAAMSAPVREPVRVQRDRPAVAPVVGQPPAPEKPVRQVPQTARIEPVPEPPAPEPVKTEAAAKPVLQEPVMTANILPVAPQVEPPPRPAAVKADPPELPVWPQIPTHLFQQLSGSLRLDVHVFGDQPQKSFVLINMRKYREGEKLQEGPQLDEITPEGVILSFSGQRFRLQAQ